MHSGVIKVPGGIKTLHIKYQLMLISD